VAGKKKPKTEVRLENSFFCHETVCRLGFFALSGQPLGFGQQGVLVCVILFCRWSPGWRHSPVRLLHQMVFCFSVSLGAGTFELWF
jgi:hypothetical protein